MSDKKEQSEDHLTFLYQQSEYIHRYIERADVKASWGFAAVSGIIIFDISKLSNLGFEEGGLAAFFLTSGIVLLTASGFHSFRVITPRLAGNPSGLIYFGSVVKIESSERFYERIISLSLSDLCAERAKHNFEIAGVCVEKFKWLQNAFYLGLAGFMASGLAHVFL